MIVRGQATAPTGIRDATHYMPQLEALRGVAILLVVFFHADALTSPTGAPMIGTWVSPFAAFIHAGHTGVTLFFVLSAFLLSRGFIAEAGGGRRVSRPRFLARRALRILPLYWLVVIVASWLDTSDHSVFSKALPHMFFLGSFSGPALEMPPYSDVWWSLGTEAQFYFVLAVATLLLGTRLGRGACLALVVSYLAFYFGMASGRLSSHLWANILGRGPSFLIGIGAAWIYERHGVQLRERCSQWKAARWGGGDLALLALVLCLGFLLRQVTFRGFYSAEWAWHQWHVAEAFLWASILLLTLVAPLRLGALLTNRLMGTMGVLSYSIYLLHLPILLFVLDRFGFVRPEVYQGWTPTLLAAVLACLALVIVASSITYLSIERPVLKRKARIND